MTLNQLSITLHNMYCRERGWDSVTAREETDRILKNITPGRPLRFIGPKHQQYEIIQLAGVGVFRDVAASQQDGIDYQLVEVGPVTSTANSIIYPLMEDQCYKKTNNKLLLL